MQLKDINSGKIYNANTGINGNAEFTLDAPGTIKEITGIEEVKSMPEVEDVVIAHYPGETITGQMRGLLTQITIRVLGSVDTKERLLSVMQKINETIHIIGEDSRELLLPGVEYEDINGFIS